MQPYYDVLVVVPLEEEFEIVQESFAITSDISTDSQIRFEARVGESGPSVLLIRQDTMGKTSMADAVAGALSDSDFGLLVCVGIAGGLSNDAAIGDVCVSLKVFDALDNAKITDNSKTKKQSVTLAPSIYETPLAVATAMSRDRMAPDTANQYNEWRTKQGTASRALISGSFRGRKGRDETIQDPTVRAGSIACGMVSGSPEYNQALLGLDRKMLAIETESGGLFHAAKQAGKPALTVRGISDYAGADKNLFEEETDNQARRVAASNAATYLAGALSRSKLGSYLQSLRDQRAGNEPLLIPAAEPDPIAKATLSIGEEVETRLRELAPSYALLSKGYRLPVPRCRLEKKDDPSGSLGEPMEIRDALLENRSVVINVPREYPDLSLAWVIAKDLLTAQKGDRPFLPFVVEGNSIAPPKSGVLAKAGEECVAVSNDKNAQIVFVIDNFSFASRTRAAFLATQFAEHPEAIFLILSKSRSHQVSESDFIKTTNATQGMLVGISFAEMAFFLQKNFEMPTAASQVVASRLHETFDEFNLPVHPTFFAGIPRDTLTALLEANRRAELIQLAVAGYLSFVVASDTQDVRLSRTTRESFLTSLVVDMRINKRSFDQAALVSYAAELAERKHYKISPATFVASFLEKGILHEDGGSIHFTLPFIESYLLAKRLTSDEKSAIAYFDIYEDDFDVLTFSLYAELGPSQGVVDHISMCIDDGIAGLQTRSTDGPHILLGDLLSPPLMKRTDRMRMFQNRVEEAVKAVRDDHDETSEKQSFLDAAQRVREEAAERTVKEATKRSTQDVMTVEERAMAAWYAGVTMLGAAAEPLEGSTKVDFINRLLVLSSLAVDCWTRDEIKFDYSQMKKDIINDQALLTELLSKFDEDKRPDVERFIETLIDIMEYTVMCRPFQTVVATLCEEARHPVLAESLSRAQPETDFERLLRAIWLADVDVKAGKTQLNATIKDLPKARMLRVNLATHLLTRVYWKHWKPEDRLALLDAADQAVRDQGQTINKAEIIRLIDKDKRTKEAEDEDKKAGY